LKKKNQEFPGFCFFPRMISPPCLGPCQTIKNNTFYLYSYLAFFSARVLETHLGGLKAVCIGPALSNFCPSVCNVAT
jgi:hypothetical protein